VLAMVGLLQVMAGVLAIAVPEVASFAAMLFFGAALTIVSIFQIAHGVTDRPFAVKPGTSERRIFGLRDLGVGIQMVFFSIGLALWSIVLIPLDVRRRRRIPRNRSCLVAPNLALVGATSRRGAGLRAGSVSLLLSGIIYLALALDVQSNPKGAEICDTLLSCH